MTHFCAFVFSAARPDRHGLEEQLWPWSLYNLESPHSRRFDFFEIGGQFEGHLDLRGSAIDATMSRSRKQKRTIPVDALRGQAVAAAASRYDEAHRILAGRPLPDIAELTRRHGENGWSDVFHADPAVKAVNQSRPFLDPWRLAALATPRDLFLRRAAERALLPHAFVDDGALHTYDSFCLDEDQAVADAWRDTFHGAFDAAGPDSWVKLVDCHC